MHFKLILRLCFLKFYYAHGKKMSSHFLLIPPKITGHRKLSPLFVNVVFKCTYCIVFHISFGIVWMQTLGSCPQRVWLTRHSVFFLYIYFFYKHLDLMQTCNSLHTQNAWVENIQLWSPEKDLVTQAPFTCCCIAAYSSKLWCSLSPEPPKMPYTTSISQA